MALGLPAAHRGSGQALQEGVDKANAMQTVPLSCTSGLVGNDTWLQLDRRFQNQAPKLLRNPLGEMEGQAPWKCRVSLQLSALKLQDCLS